MIPGEIITHDGDIELNPRRKTRTLAVSNTGDRPIQVGSHYHFFETNEALRFERKTSLGMRLNIASGTAVRFEPGQARTVELVELAGSRTVYGFRGLVMGSLTPKKVSTVKAATGTASRTTVETKHAGPPKTRQTVKAAK